MATVNIRSIIDLTPQLLNLPVKQLWSSYDEEADVLYINFRKPSHADDSVLTEDDIILRYEKDDLVGITVLHASTRKIT